ncbi:MAG: discoidin domain-containing protein [Campylobacter sp.]|uniref:discoidin domain-containing protein n=1 Tax=Campylobacter sp. TaxID=205 RepID=UPI001AFD1599|nr:discoidin domain-containing protein [Campylobacter sp.]MBO5063483.1 discoidin domain-containing protein [Campylobacter sp.]
MIWKEEDVIDLTKGKKALQSSISKWSHIDDANRAIDPNIEDCNFAFHTGCEDKAYWMVDLEAIEPIDCIRITNRAELKHQKINQNLSVECSLDGIVWTKIDPNMHEWNNLDVLEINVLQSLSARYVKISLNVKGHLVLKKVEVLKRKYHYIAGSRADALGMRLSVLISAIYVAKHLDGFKFVFSWMEGTNDDHRGAVNNSTNFSSCGEILRANEIFSEEFLKKHQISSKYRSHGNDIINLSFNDSKGKFLQRKWGIFTGKIGPHKCMRDIVPEEVLCELKECYQSIQWSYKCKQIIQEVEQICNEIIADDFVILHMRGGEVVLGDFKVAPWLWANTKHFPYEVAIEIAKMEWSNNNIVIAGQDFTSNQILENYLNKIKPNKDIKIYSIDSLIKDRYNYTNPERSFFDINFLSKAKKIYATGASMFSNTASMMAGKELTHSFYDIYSDEELYNIIQKNINCLEIGNLHRAYCYYRLYDFAIKLNMPLQVAQDWLYKAMQEDNDNDWYRIAIIDTFFKEKDLKKIDLYLKTDCIYREKFFEAIYGPHNTMNKWCFKYYDSLRDKYLKYADTKYPYISYMAAKISFCRKNISDALKYIKYSLAKDPSNKFFLSLYAEIKSKIDDKNDTPIAKLKTDINIGTAKERITNTLSYKLGQAMIKNSNSVIGYIKMPFILNNIRINHAKEKIAYHNKIKNNLNLKLPSLDSYSDYTEALKLKNHLSYKLGEALIDASKNWYKGGYIKFLFKINKLKTNKEK